MPIRFENRSVAFLLASALLLSACGNRGALILPPPAPTTAQAPAAAKAAGDHNSTPVPAAPR